MCSFAESLTYVLMCIFVIAKREKSCKPMNTKEIKHFECNVLMVACQFSRTRNRSTDNTNDSEAKVTSEITFQLEGRNVGVDPICKPANHVLVVIFGIRFLYNPAEIYLIQIPCA